MKCPVCNNVNNDENKYCFNCGIQLIDNNDIDDIREDKLVIPENKIILLDLNYL